MGLSRRAHPRTREGGRDRRGAREAAGGPHLADDRPVQVELSGYHDGVHLKVGRAVRRALDTQSHLADHEALVVHADGPDLAGAHGSVVLGVAVRRHVTLPDGHEERLRIVRLVQALHLEEKVCVCHFLGHIEHVVDPGVRRAGTAHVLVECDQVFVGVYHGRAQRQQRRAGQRAG